MLATAAIIVSLALMMCYIVASSIEFGVSFLQFYPRYIGSQTILRQYLSPWWQVTNNFLLGALVVVGVTFPSAVTALGWQLVAILMTTVVLILIRAALQLQLFYREVPSGASLANGLFLAASLAIPVVLSQVFVATAGGRVGLFQPASVATGVVALVVVLSLASTFFAAVAPPHGRVAQARTANLRHRLAFILAALITLVLPPVFATVRPDLNSQNLVVVLFAVTIILGLGYLIAEHTRQLLVQWSMLVIYVLMALALFAVQQLPYIAYPGATLTSAFIGSQSSGLILGCLFLGVAIAIFGVSGLYRLAVTPLESE